MSAKTHSYMTDDGVKQFVLHSDYAALEEKNKGLEKRCDRMSIAYAELNANAAELQARHNALREAAVKMRHANNKDRWDALEWVEARAEVDRLMEEKP